MSSYKVQIHEHEPIDPEWVYLMFLAGKMALSIDQVREFLYSVAVAKTE
ncbi:anti-repressor SinI family protein [Alicyclobacillus tolerans]|nr:anti-repressor SinI family protein [Alicyclobacillus tolerans]MCF8563945.1 anti-repressor SinI family protein [Alicyclobacillus tolerans]